MRTNLVLVYRKHLNLDIFYEYMSNKPIDALVGQLFISLKFLNSKIHGSMYVHLKK
jgi:hypothetical protein